MRSSTAGHIALVGLSGSGKSTVAPLVASRTGTVAVDLDRLVEDRFGRGVADVFETEGEAVFRTAEADALAQALAGRPCVIATGGGVVLSPENRLQLRSNATVIWLRAHPQHLSERLADSTEARPLLEGDLDFALHRLAEERDALYGEVADLVVDVDGIDPVSVSEEILRATDTA